MVHTAPSRPYCVPLANPIVSISGDESVDGQDGSDDLLLGDGITTTGG
jgi:hypothetical protein